MTKRSPFGLSTGATSIGRIIIICALIAYNFVLVGFHLGTRKAIEKQNGGSTQSKKAAAPVERPKGLRLVIAGDETSRSQYLSLVYFLKTGEWESPDKTEKRFSREQKDFGNKWHNFFQYTNEMLAPYELCDCFRADDIGIYNYWNKMMENRYFYDKELDNYVVYLQKLGSTASYANWMPESINFSPETDSVTKLRLAQINPEYIGHSASYPSWADLVENHVSKLTGGPSKITHFVFNSAGQFSNNDSEINDIYRQDSLVSAIRSSGIVGIYRSSVKQSNRKNQNLLSYETALCKKLDNKCLDISWTGGLPIDMYWDMFHIKEPAYRWMNEDLLRMLGFDQFVSTRPEKFD